MKPPNQTSDLETWQDLEAAAEPSLAVTAYEENIGHITPLVAEKISDATNDYTELAVVDAIRTAAARDVQELELHSGLAATAAKGAGLKMESLEDILKRLDPTTSSAGTGDSNANAAIADAEYHCEICDDARWLSLDAPVGSPEFGRVIPCHCQERVWGVSPHDRLRHYSDLGALQRLTFDSLDPSGRPDYVEPASFRRAQVTAARFAGASRRLAGPDRAVRQRQDTSRGRDHQLHDDQGQSRPFRRRT